VQLASLTAFSVLHAAFPASAFALQAAHAPPAVLQAAQSAFPAPVLQLPSFVQQAAALSAGATAGAGVFGAAYAETVSAAIDMAIMNFFMDPPCLLLASWYLSTPS
jgi:hypothetical protein